MLETSEIRAQLETVKSRLQRILGFSSESLAAHEKPSVMEAMPASGDDEFSDSATETFNQELDAMLKQRYSDRLVEIEGALARLAVGQYGRCMKCGLPIPEGRLKAVPETPFCVECGRGSEAQG